MTDEELAGAPVYLQQALARGEVTEDELVARLNKADCCPRCGSTAPLRVTTGLCGVCHYRILAATYRDRQAEDAARREYEAEKKAAQRRVRCQECGREYSPRRSTDRAVCPDCRRS